MSTLSTTTGGFGEAALSAFLQGRDEPGWLVDRRRKALAAFQAMPLPSSKDEEWRRTDIRGLSLDRFAPPAGTDAEISGLESNWDELSGHYATGLAHVNGSVARKADASKLGGAVLLDLADAAKSHPDLLKRYLFADESYPDAFAALHAAFWTGGTLLYVPKGVAVGQPLFTLVGMVGAGEVDLDHTLVVIEDGAEAALVRETVSKGRSGPGLHVGSVQLHVGDNANLTFVNLQNWDDSTWHFSRERAYVGGNGRVQWTVGAIGSKLSKVNQEVALTGQGADAQVNGVMFTTGKQHLAYFTRQDHQAPNTRSDLLYKAGLKDRSRIVWKGMIRVEKDAQKTDAYQKNDNLILSDAARADSIPGLEIEANDVRCTHGATAGRVDEEMIFYAEARGIRRDTAIRLIVEGFFANVYDRITLEPVRETLRLAVAEKLEIGTTPTLVPA